MNQAHDCTAININDFTDIKSQRANIIMYGTELSMMFSQVLGGLLKKKVKSTTVNLNKIHE
jgi:hypothetical protein